MSAEPPEFQDQELLTRQALHPLTSQAQDTSQAQGISQGQGISQAQAINQESVLLTNLEEAECLQASLLELD